MEYKIHNGWTNYETWTVNVWLNDDGMTQSYWSKRAEDIARNALSTNMPETEGDYLNAMEEAVSELSDEIKANIEENMPVTKGLYADLLNAAISECNFYEIAKDMVSESWDQVAVEHKEENQAI